MKPASCLDDVSKGTAASADLEDCACPRCGGGSAVAAVRSPDRQFPSAGVFTASRCTTCGLLFQNPRVSGAALAKHYPADYAPYEAAELGLDEPSRWHLQHRQGYAHLGATLQPTARQRRYGEHACCFQLLPDYAPGGTVLEFGCAAGNRLALLKRLGWQNCVGNEYSESAAGKARQRGLEVLAGPVEDALAKFPDASLDAILGGFVIEHVTNPFNLTRELARKLRPGGQFLFSTVNIESPCFWLYGPHWYDLDLPRHMVFFRRQDLRAMLSHDFVIEWIQVESALNDYLGSARYRRRDGIGGWRGCLDATLLRLDGRLARPLRWMARAGLGARIYVCARKK